MNILIFNEEPINPERGGINRVSYVLGKAFEQDGNLVIYLMCKYSEETKSTNYYFLPDGTNYQSRKNYKYVRQLCADYSVEVILNQNGISPPCSEFILRSAPSNVKIFTVPHNSLINTYGMKVHLPSLLIEKTPLFLLDFLDQIANIILFWKYKTSWDTLLAGDYKIVLLSKQLLYSTSRFLGVSPNSNKFTWVENPCTLENVDHTIPLKKRELLYVGRLSKEKNIIGLLKSWKTIQDRFEEWNLIIVGYGNLQKELEKYVKEKEINRITFTGRQNPIPFYRNASIFCMTSLFEGMPLVINEAMAFGCVPVVFNSFETASSIVDDGVNGLLVPPFSTQKYALALSSLMEDNNKLERMRNNAFRSSKNYSISIIKEKWYKLFNS